MSKNTITRSLIKTITYRIIGTLTTTAISYAVTGDLKLGLFIGGIDVTSKMVIYFAHEIVWQNIEYGKKD